MELRTKAIVRRAKYLHGEKRSVRRTGASARDRRDRHTGRHLHRCIESVQSVERTARDRNSDYWQNRSRGKNAAEMRSASSRRDDDL